MNVSLHEASARIAAATFRGPRCLRRRRRPPSSAARAAIFPASSAAVDGGAGRLARRASRGRRGSASPSPISSSVTSTTSSDALAHDAERVLAGERRVEPVGDRARLRPAPARPPRAPRQRGRALGLDADDAAADRRRDARDQPAPADRHDDDRVDVRHVLDDLEPERPVAGLRAPGRRTDGRTSRPVSSANASRRS